MLDYIFEMFSFGFMQKALLVGTLISLCAALLGASLVLKRYSMIGDGLSHIGFGALAIAAAMNWAPMPFAVPVVVLAAFMLLRLSGSNKLKGDAAIALLSSSALAVGMIVVSVSEINFDVNSYMFGSILALDDGDVTLSVITSILTLILFVLFYNKIFAVTFDETFARATGTRAGLYNTVIALLTAMIIVVGMRLMGALLISSLVIFPALTSMRLCKSFRTVTICSVIVSVFCFLAGLFLTYALSLPTGATIVAVNLTVFLLFAAVGKLRGRA